MTRKARGGLTGMTPLLRYAPAYTKDGPAPVTERTRTAMEESMDKSVPVRPEITVCRQRLIERALP